jgi:hypothetical protein
MMDRSQILLASLTCAATEWTTFHSWFAAGVQIDEILVEVHGRAVQVDPILFPCRPHVDPMLTPC